MYHANESTWNIRDKHMVDSISNLLQFHSQKFKNLRKEKCVIWVCCNFLKVTLSLIIDI